MKKQNNILGKKIKAVISAGLLIVISTAAAKAFVVDGMLNDWGIDLLDPLSSSINYLDSNLPAGERNVDVFTEDNADNRAGWQIVLPGWTYGGNIFDAEAMYVDNDDENLYIAIVTGLPESGAQSPDGNIFTPGDIAFDVDMDGSYEYGLDIGDSYLYSVDSWIDPVYPDFAALAGPWAIGSGQQVGLAEMTYSGNQNTHFVIEARIPLVLLGLANAYVDAATQYLNINWTMECGNDFLNLDADVNPVPEPGTLLLLGAGLIGMMAFRRR